MTDEVAVAVARSRMAADTARSDLFHACKTIRLASLLERAKLVQAGVKCSHTEPAKSYRTLARAPLLGY